MDLSNRGAQPQTVGSQPSAGSSTSRQGKSGKDKDKWGRIAVVAAIAAVVILLLAVIVLAFSNNGGKQESDYVDSSKLQAVFLNTGQVYFGNVESMNNRFVVLTDIYYLQTTGGNNASAQNNSSNSNANVSLVKLGCELHEPYDQMVINREQITFWENLGDNGQVATAVATFEKQNPNGQKCADQSTSAGTNTGNSTQNANGNNSANTNSNTTTNP